MTNKDRDEIREILAKALSDSLIGKVEQNIMNVLSPKLGALQTKQAEAEAKTDTAKAELIKVTNLITSAEAKLAEFKETRIRADKEFEDITKNRAKVISDLNRDLQEHREAVAQSARFAQDQIEESRKISAKTIAEHQAEIDAKKAELEELKRAHEDFKKVVGLG